MTGASKQGKDGKWRPMIRRGENHVAILGDVRGFDTKAEADAFGQEIMSESIYWDTGDGIPSAPERTFYKAG